jgi:hypothetical protein
MSDPADAVARLASALQRIEALLPTPCDDSDHEIMMMVGTATDLQAAIQARNVRQKVKGLRRRSDA